MATAVGGTPPSNPNGNNGGLPPLPSVPPTSGVPHSPSVLSQKGELEQKPSFVFKTSPGLGSEETGSAPPLPLTQVTPKMLPSPPGSNTPRVGEKSSSPMFLNEISDESEDAEPIGGSPGKGKDDLKTASQGAQTRKQARPSSVLLEISPGLATVADIADAKFSSTVDDDKKEKGEKAKNPAKNAGDDPPKSSLGASTATSASHGAAKPVSEREIDQVLDDLLADYKDQAPPALPFSTPSNAASSPPTDSNPGTIAPSGARKEKVEPAPEQKTATSAQPASPSTTNPPVPDSGKNAPVPSSTSKPLPPSNPPAASSPSAAPPVSASPSQPPAQLPRLDAFDSVSRKKRRVSKDSDDEADVSIDGTGSPKSARGKKSPRSEKQDKAKRRSQTKAALTLQPRYVPHTRKSDAKVQTQATVEQCQALLRLLEGGCDEELRQNLLGALVGMVFKLPQQNRAEVLERAWRCARSLPEAQLLQWSHRVLTEYQEARALHDHDSSEDESGASYKEATKAFNSLCTEVKSKVGTKEWNALAKLIVGKKNDPQTQLMATAVAIDNIKGLKDNAAIYTAMAALRKTLGAKLVIAAFFQSSACPDSALLRTLIAHTASAVLHGVLAGDKQAVEDFKEVLKSDSVADGLERALLECVKELAPRQPGSGSAAPVTTTGLHGNGSTSTSSTAPRRATPTEDTILDIVQELLLLEGQPDTPAAAHLPDEAICRLLGALALDRETALRAIGSCAYDNVSSYIHGVCSATLTPVSCHSLLNPSAPDAKRQMPPLLHHLMANGDMEIALPYLRKLIDSDITKTELCRLLRGNDRDGMTALEGAIRTGRDRNVQGFIGFVHGLDVLDAKDEQDLFPARRTNGTAGLLSAIRSGGSQLKMGVYAYAKGLLGLNEKKISKRDVVGILTDADDDGLQPLRLALMNNDAGVVSGMVQAICEADGLDDKAREALLSGQFDTANGKASFIEMALAEYYKAVKEAYQTKFTGKPIPKKIEVGLFGAKVSYFSKNENPFDGVCKDTEAEAKKAWEAERDESLHAMLSLLPEADRNALKAKGRSLMIDVQAKRVSGFHTALMKGCAQSVSAYIQTVLQYGKSTNAFKPVDLLLAKDAHGNSALFNAMENNEFGAVEVYVDAMLASTLPITEKNRLLLDSGEIPTAIKPEKYTPLQVAMASGNYGAMNAYVAAVLHSSLKDDDKQHLLFSVGGNGKPARQTVLELAQRQPETHGKCIQMFDEMIKKSTLSSAHKNFLTKAYQPSGNAKKS